MFLNVIAQKKRLRKVWDSNLWNQLCVIFIVKLFAKLLSEVGVSWKEKWVVCLWLSCTGCVQSEENDFQAKMFKIRVTGSVLNHYVKTKSIVLWLGHVFSSQTACRGSVSGSSVLLDGASPMQLCWADWDKNAYAWLE